MKNLFTLSERLKGWLVGMVKLVMQSLKATKRQSDTTIFAKSLKSLMSIFSSRGVMDVRLSLGQYRTDYQRISNLYLTPNRYFTRFAAVFALVFVLGVGNVWGADPTEDIVLSSGSFSTDHITWSGTSCTIQQLKGTSSNAVNSSYISAPRVYKGHVLSFVAKTGYKIKSISIKVDGTYYGNSMTAGTTISSNTVTNNRRFADVDIHIGRYTCGGFRECCRIRCHIHSERSIIFKCSATLYKNNYYLRFFDSFIYRYGFVE